MDQIGEQLLGEVTKFFAGPRSNADPIPAGNSPLDMYTTGILFPINIPQNDVSAEDNEDAEGKEESDSEMESKVLFKQNSIGIRVELKKEIKKIRILINYGKYTCNTDDMWGRHELDKNKQIHDIDLTDEKGEIAIINDADSIESKIWWKVYNGTILNVFLENCMTRTNFSYAEKTKGSADGDKNNQGYKKTMKHDNQNAIFQPSISLQSLDDTGVFKPLLSNPHSHRSQEDRLFDMLYRDEKIFGVGYGCAVDWEPSNNPTYVRTILVPDFEDYGIEKYAKDMDEQFKPSRIDIYELGCFEDLDDHDANRRIIARKISPMIDRYEKWIHEQTKKIDLIDDEHKDTAVENMKKCSVVLGRIKDGLRLLTEGDGEDCKIILKAFILANRAMLYQRLHFTFALNKFKNKKEQEWPNVKKPGQVFWYPFQIAFLLMTIRGIAFKEHDDNSIVDLIWFPTGGGKTEAYLGVAAFTMLLRRLRGDVEDGLGVSVITRYTLRLLTLQQFERTSTLICALEYLRRRVKNSGLGTEPFLLGLWVGSSLTPNHSNSSSEALRQLTTNPRISPTCGSPCQTSYCPWCGNQLTPSKNYKFDKNTKWTLVRCTNVSSPCIFTDNTFSYQKILPLVTVDSDIYARCPSMIIATVDKFAQLPFKRDIANIFGRASRRCKLHGFLSGQKSSICQIVGEGTHREGNQHVHDIRSIFPPDLIIQDEIHLISGPLGTMVGLYETAVDFLTTNDKRQNVRPKVIVSTATIKGAQEQIRKIFNRTTSQPFPPPGIDRNDTFFWWTSEQSGKMFVGVSFSQRSAKHALAKLYATLLQKMEMIRSSKEVVDEKLDPYWTLVGYYNSLRELGSANRLIEDDVVKNMRFLAETIHGSKNDVRDLGSPENGIEEITGGKTQREIGEIRDKLEKSLPDIDVISVLLATNMISVGIDIDRLALMAVNGQPKTATEYIQATGRIGRRENASGCVFVSLNPYKPRDLSHYENFVGFHMTMQKQVEPSTLTPFSIPAYTRALHAVLFAMIRLGNPRLRENIDAAKFQMGDGEIVTKFILERFKSVEQVGEDSNSYKQFKKKLITLQGEWVKFNKEFECQTNDVVQYCNTYDRRNHDESMSPNVLMVEFARHAERESSRFPLSTPESLRDVEPQVTMEYV